MKIARTGKALIMSLSMLLESKRFGKLTVNDITEEAQISRATFYAYFHDKYDLLEHWLIMNLKPKIVVTDTYEHLEKTVNGFIAKNKKVVKNIVMDADQETLDILFQFILSVIVLPIEEYIDGKRNPQYIVYSHLCAGGIVSFLQWEAENDFPIDVPLMNRYLYDALGSYINI